MKTFPAILIALGLGLGGGYWLGLRAKPPAAPTPKPRVVHGPIRAILTVGDSDQVMDWQTLLHTPNEVDPNLLNAWARGLGSGDIAATLDALNHQPASRRRDDLLAAVYNAWAEQDPKGFLADNSRITIPRLREVGVDAALKTWAATDPKAALDWVKNNPGTTSAAADRERYAAAIAGYVQTDPLAAVAYVGALPDDNSRNRDLKTAATTALADALAEQGQYNQALSFFSHLPPGDNRDAAYAQLAQHWSQAAPEDAAAWVEGIQGDQHLKTAMGTEVAQTWAELDPAAAAAWAAKIDLAPPGPDTPAGSTTNGQLLATAVRTWTDYDLDSAGQFLNQLPNTPAKDPAVAIFALRASLENPSDVFAWVNTISDESLRMRITGAVALQWMKQDPDGYKQFLGNTTQLSDQQRQMLMNIPPEALGSLAQFNDLLGGGDSAQKILEQSLIKESDGVNHNVNQSPQN